MSANVLVIGAGAAGAAASWSLAARGLKVLCLEQGDWFDQRGLPHAEPDWELARQRAQHPNPNVRSLRADYPVGDSDTPIKPLMYNAVGGSTIHWGAQFPRLHPSDFRVRTLDSVADDWPISFDDLASYYDLNDQLMGVAGRKGDPANPPRQEISLPPLPFNRGAARVAAAFNRLGWHWWPSNVAIATVPFASAAACNGCGPCDLGCPTQARATADNRYLASMSTTVRPGARAAEITVDAGGRATGAIWIDRDGRRRHEQANVVVLAANGIGTPRLLLLSGGLGNRSGLVGRNLMHHPTARVAARLDERCEGWKGPYACAFLSQEFYETDRMRGFARGYQMQFVRGVGLLGAALGAHFPRLPWGENHHAAFDRQLGRTATLNITSEDLPDPDNRVTLDSALTDSTGLPAPRLAYRVGENTRAMLDHGIARASEALRLSGAIDLHVTPLVAQAGFHLLGTARMGADPERSVVDPWCRAHDVPNLFVIDGSVFVTAGAVNPTATIQAIALRAADHIWRTRRDMPTPAGA